MPPIFRFLNYRIEKKKSKNLLPPKKTSVLWDPTPPSNPKKKIPISCPPLPYNFTGIALTRPGHQRNI